MDEQMVKMAVDEVMEELNMSKQRYTIETAMGAPNAESIQVRVFDRGGDGKAVVVNLRDEDGVTVYEDEIKERIRQQLRTFAEITE